MPKKTIKKPVKKTVKKKIKKAVSKKKIKFASKKKVVLLSEKQKKSSDKKTATKPIKKESSESKVIKKKVLKPVKKNVPKSTKSFVKKAVRKVVNKAIKKNKPALVKKKKTKVSGGNDLAVLKKTEEEISLDAKIPKLSKTVKKYRIDVDVENDRPKELTPMRIYLNQIEKIPLLNPAEELELSEIIQKKKEGWKQARKKMIQCNLRLVINISKRYMNLGLPFSDLVEEGNIGLMRAVDKFNYKRGYRFSTYASWWIKQSVMRALSNQGKLIRIPVHMFETMSKWRKVCDYLKQKNGRLPSHKEVSTIMKISIAKVKEIEHAAKTYPSSLHTPVSIDGDAELIDLIEDDSTKMPHEEVHSTLKNERISKFFDFVNEREKTILIMRFGLNNNDTHTLEETAQVFGITRERVRQIEEAALKKIRARLASQNDKLQNYI